MPNPYDRSFWTTPYEPDYEEYPDTDLLPMDDLPGVAQTIVNAASAASGAASFLGRLQKGLQPDQGQVRPKRGVITTSRTAVAKRARRAVHSEKSLVITWPIGRAYRVPPQSTGTYWGAIPVRPWASDMELFEWSPDEVIYGFQPSAAGATDSVLVDFKRQNMMPFHEIYNGTIPAFVQPLGTYAAPTVHQRMGEIQLEYNNMRVSGRSLYCTMQLDVNFLLPEPHEVAVDDYQDFRVRVVMLQINEETSAIARYGYILNNFYLFGATGVRIHTDGLSTKRIPEYMKNEAKEAEMVNYSVLIDQVIDLKNITTSTERPHLTLRQAMGQLPLDDDVNYQTDGNRTQLRINRAGRILWGIFQLNNKTASPTTGEPPSDYVYAKQIQYHGNWKLIFNDSNF